MLNFQDIVLRRGAECLIESGSFQIHPGWRVGLTGRNGAGKSSLFAILLGTHKLDGGIYSAPPNTRWAHMAQEVEATDQSAMDYVLDGDAVYRRLEQELSLEEDGNKLAQLYQDFENAGGYTVESRAGEILHGLGFAADRIHESVKNFSGGWRMRLNLARALICPSDVLLLDEPTNHLDLDAILWLQNWLVAYTGTLFLVSHDRDFLDFVTTHIVHIDQKQAVLYTGNYSSFERLRAEKLANQQALFAKQERTRAHLQSFVDRFRAQATKARQAQSRLKALEKLTLTQAAYSESGIDFNFFEPNKLPDTLLSLHQAQFGYKNNILLNNINLSLHPNQRIGLLGRNGAGKSTLIKGLANTLDLLKGTRTPAEHLQMGYFAQHQLEQLDPDASPLLHMIRKHPTVGELNLRSYLGSFGFNGDMALKNVAPFSGGEKARLCLALMIYQKPNLLLLDEPTNHLDLEMRHALMMALQNYSGAMILVSHDRHLLRTVCDEFYWVHDGIVEPFTESLEVYEQQISKKSSAPKSNKNNPKNQNNTSNLSPNKPIIANNIDSKTAKKQQKIEQEIAKLQARQSELLLILADNKLYEKSQENKLNILLSEQKNNQIKLEELELSWLELV